MDGEYPAEAFCMTFKNKADFVEVVRCKDCVKRGLTECPMLIINIDLGGIVCRDDCFCSYGERREK